MLVMKVPTLLTASPTSSSHIDLAVTFSTDFFLWNEGQNRGNIQFWYRVAISDHHTPTRVEEILSYFIHNIPT